MIEPDHYAVLGVPPDATAAEIERAYRQHAGQRLNARWRPSRAARELSQINAAYGVLGYPDRRSDYDRRRAAEAAMAVSGQTPNGLSTEPGFAPPAYSRQRRQSLPRVQLGRPTGSSPADAFIILLVVMLALLAATALASRSLVDLSFVQNLSETLGVTSRRRAVPSPTAAPPAELAAVRPSPESSPTPAQPGALPTALTAQRFAGSEVAISDQTPARRENITVTLKLLREGQPVPNANVYLTAYFRTVSERQPPGTSTVRTDNNGTASITFNVGDATPNFRVNLDVTALVEGQQVVFQSFFTPT